MKNSIQLDGPYFGNYDVSAHGDGFTVSRDELVEFVVRAAAALSLPSLGCVDGACEELPRWVTLSDVAGESARIVCEKHRLEWDAEQPAMLDPIQWRKVG